MTLHWRYKVIKIVDEPRQLRRKNLGESFCEIFIYYKMANLPSSLFNRASVHPPCRPDRQLYTDTCLVSLWIGRSISLKKWRFAFTIKVIRHTYKHCHNATGNKYIFSASKTELTLFFCMIAITFCGMFAQTQHGRYGYYILSDEIKKLAVNKEK